MQAASRKPSRKRPDKGRVLRRRPTALHPAHQELIKILATVAIEQYLKGRLTGEIQEEESQ
jgi:hypothetical protein